jgi:ABC-2 type transport system permease protein
MNSLIRILAILRKEFLQLSRDKLTFGMVIGIPLIQLILFGYAINTDVRHLPAGVADQSNTHLSRQTIAEMAASQVVDFQHQVQSAEQLESLLDSGTISIGLFIPADFDRRVIAQDRKAAQLLVDGSDPIILGVARQLTTIPIAFDTQPKVMQDNGGLEVRTYYNPERRSAVNIVPGLIGVILTMTMVMFTSVAIVREKERGNLELLINTPVRTTELMLGKIFPYVLIGLVQVTIILALGWLIFDVPLRGDSFDILCVSLLFIAANLTLGLFVSTLAKTQFQAMQMTFFFFLPSILLSGFMFPFDGMPKYARMFAEILPLTHFNRLIRGIVLRGADMQSMPQELLALGLFMVLMMGFAVMRFSKRLD